MRQLLTTSLLSFNFRILLDGLSIPFFNLGKNVSRTFSLSTTLTSSRSRFQPDWVLNINRIVATLQEPTSEVPDAAVRVQEDASAAASTNTPTIIDPSQTPDIESGLIVDAKWWYGIVKEVHFPWKIWTDRIMVAQHLDNANFVQLKLPPSNFPRFLICLVRMFLHSLIEGSWYYDTNTQNWQEFSCHIYYIGILHKKISVIYWSMKVLYVRKLTHCNFYPELDTQVISSWSARFLSGKLAPAFCQILKILSFRGPSGIVTFKVLIVGPG